MTVYRQQASVIFKFTFYIDGWGGGGGGELNKKKKVKTKK